MKFQLFILLAAALSFTACDNTEFATPSNDTGMRSAVSDIGTGDDGQGLETCMSVESDHRLGGTGRLRGSYYSGFSGAYGTYEVTASGSAESDPLKDGNTIIRFTYQPSTSTIVGNMSTSYKNGAVLEQKFEGIAQRQINGKSMVLTLDLSSAQLQFDADLFLLSEGVITLTMPAQPLGNIEVMVHTRGMYCTED